MELELGQPILLFGSIPVSQSGMTELSFLGTGSSRGRSGVDLESSDTLVGEYESLIVQDPRFSFVSRCYFNRWASYPMVRQK